jgi:hypothetical protein
MILRITNTTNTTLASLRKGLRTRGVRGLHDHKKDKQCSRSGNTAYVALTPRNVVGTWLLILILRSAVFFKCALINT